MFVFFKVCFDFLFLFFTILNSITDCNSSVNVLKSEMMSFQWIWRVKCERGVKMNGFMFCTD